MKLEVLSPRLPIFEVYYAKLEDESKKKHINEFCHQSLPQRSNSSLKTWQLKIHIPLSIESRKVMAIIIVIVKVCTT